MEGIMIQGTSSDAGKSFIVTALCRVLAQDGYRVAPFKSQNMSNNSYVTIDGYEIGRAQGVQALAAKIEPSIWHNPILLKPKSNTNSEIVLLGEVYESLEGRDYYEQFALNKGLETIQNALDYLEKNYDCVCIEGAGSPVEVNLNDYEIVNMRVAKMADVPVILVTDIDRGGSLASIVGTLELLEQDKKQVKGIIFNKFRGDISLFDDAITFIEKKTGVKVVGVLPYLTDVIIENEDNLSTSYYFKASSKDKITIGVVELPFVSNNTDLEIFKYEKDVELVKFDQYSNIEEIDALIIPGTKSTIEDYIYLENNGIVEKIMQFNQSNKFIYGICGGYQMMGVVISDSNQVDNDHHTMIKTLGLLPVHTTFATTKKVSQITGSVVHHGLSLQQISGYEIHFGQSQTMASKDVQPLFIIDGMPEGLASHDLKRAGSYVHNVFNNDQFRTDWLNAIRQAKGYSKKGVVDTKTIREADFDKLADYARKYLDIDYIKSIMKGAL